MISTLQEIYAVLTEYNPWWRGAEDPGLPAWRRAAFGELFSWLHDPPSRRAVLLNGARQIGKTTLLKQAVQSLLEKGVDPERILYVTFDHGLLKLAGIEFVLKSWQEFRPPRSGGIDYLLLDEIQYVDDWQTWIKHQVDFHSERRIAATGSAIPLTADKQESGVGRWHTIKLATLSFYEYLKLRGVLPPPKLPQVKSLLELFGWKPQAFTRVGELARPLIPEFHEYLLRGGFPEAVQMRDATLAQKLLREDIVDKVLKRDMTALYGVRQILDLEKVFLYLCLHDGGILDVKAISSALELSRQTVSSYLNLLESAHLIYRLSPFGGGKQVLRGQQKAYLADPAIAGSVMLRGRSLLEDPVRLGNAVEAAFFKHVFTRYYKQSIGFSYWRHAKTQKEVDIIAETGDRLIPFEVKYRARIDRDDLSGLNQFCADRQVDNAYLITRDIEQFGIRKSQSPNTKILSIPAVLACFWLSQLEHDE